MDFRDLVESLVQEQMHSCMWREKGPPHLRQAPDVYYVCVGIAL